MALIANLKGDTGAPGSAGSTGAAGNKFHNGSGAPESQTSTLLAELTAAIAGDWYLDTATDDLYKKTQAAGSPWLNTP